MTHGAPRVSVVMPTWGHAAFIGRAIESVLRQSEANWELVVVDDASPDDTARIVDAFGDPRIRLVRRAENGGLGRALNDGLDRARASVIAYLPSDDVYHRAHLASLLAALDADPGAVLAYAGIRHSYNRTSAGRIEGEALQLVQVAHRRTPDRWIERGALVTDDLDRMLWSRLLERGRAIGTGAVTCEWVAHPGQLHRLLREPVGGVNPYRARFGVRGPLVFHTTVGNRIDERARYARSNDLAAPRRSGGMRILLTGELAYNPDRVLAFEERGHLLFGLWMPDPHSINTVGPLPFGHVRDLDRSEWRAQALAAGVDVIYALLNWQAVPFIHHVLENDPGIPFVFHFKEGPFICIERGLWPQLVEICERADALVFSSAEMRDWFFETVPASSRKPTLVVDGDLPKRDWLDAPRSRRLSADDGEIHTVVPGRPIGIHPPDVAMLAAQGIHLHFYGDVTQGLWRDWIPKARALAPDHLHLHANVEQDRWVAEFSRYDAGWLHVFESRNEGELARATWDDLNLPARIATLAAAGLPTIQRDNGGAVVAAQRIARELDTGVFFTQFDELGTLLRDERELARLSENAWATRETMTFDAHVDALVEFFRSVARRVRLRTA